MKRLFVLFAALLLVAALAAPAMAAGEWSFYGSARVSGWSIDAERPDPAGGPGMVSERNTRFQMQNNTRLGAIVRAPNLYSRFEFGINPDFDAMSGDNKGFPENTFRNLYAQGADAAVHTRLLFGVWDFGAGKLLVGQDYTSEFLSVSNANNAAGSDSVMIGRGVVYGGRKAQIRLEFGGLHIALVDDVGVSSADLGAPAASAVSLSIPKLVAGYKFKMDPVELTLMGSYLSYDVEQTGQPSLGVDAHSFGARAVFNLGPFVLKGAAYMAQNSQQLGLSGGGAHSAVVVNGGTPTASVIDNDTFGYVITAGWKMSDMIMFEAGYGVVEHEMDDASTANRVGGVPGGAVVAGTSGALQEDDRESYYLQAVITLAKGVFIMPEIGKDDFKKSAAGAEQGDNTYFGAKFQIDF